MRNWFPEELICEKGIMTKQQVIELGYFKMVDYNRTTECLAYNMAYVDHATAEIKTSAIMFNFKSILVANFAFLLRVCLYHMIIVALSTNPGITVILLIIVELLYIILISINFFKLKYFVSVHLFIGTFLNFFKNLIFF